jgi:hypothetical protein
MAQRSVQPTLILICRYSRHNQHYSVWWGLHLCLLSTGLAQQSRMHSRSACCDAGLCIGVRHKWKRHRWVHASASASVSKQQRLSYLWWVLIKGIFSCKLDNISWIVFEDTNGRKCARCTQEALREERALCMNENCTSALETANVRNVCQPTSLTVVCCLCC